jgi:hypothetical protein
MREGREREWMSKRIGRLPGGCRQTMAILVALGSLAVLSGCVTPIEVKQASKAQLDLLTTLDGAVGDLQQSFDQFSKSKQARIQEDGRIWIARQAIAAAFPKDKKSLVTADSLFDAHKNAVQPWIDYAFLADDIQAAIDRIDARLKKVTDSALQTQLTLEKQDWKKLQGELANKPEPVKQIESVIVDDLNNEQKTAVGVKKLLDVLRAQVALMKQLAGRVDAWLAIDVTITQEQADSLKATFSSATTALGGAK